MTFIWDFANISPLPKWPSGKGRVRDAHVTQERVAGGRCCTPAQANPPTGTNESVSAICTGLGWAGLACSGRQQRATSGVTCASCTLPAFSGSPFRQRRNVGEIPNKCQYLPRETNKIKHQRNSSFRRDFLPSFHCAEGCNFAVEEK